MQPICLPEISEFYPEDDPQEAIALGFGNQQCKCFPYNHQGEGGHMVNNLLMGFKDVPEGFPKSDLLGVTVALIHVVGQQYLPKSYGQQNPLRL